MTSLGILANLSVFASEPLVYLSKGSGEEQLRYEAGGVLISRPSRFYDKIRDIISANNIESIEDYLEWFKANIGLDVQKSQSTLKPPTFLQASSFRRAVARFL